MTKLMGEYTWAELRFALQRLRGTASKDAVYNHLTRRIIRTVLEVDSVCIDVGCHKGEILSILMQHAPQGRFYAFEPLPDCYSFLTREFRGENIAIFDFALSDQQGRSMFNYVVSNPGYSGFLRRRYDRPREEDTQIEVRTELLDNVVTPEDRVAFIKIDVEGAELQVLRGARRTIARDKPVIVFEHGLGAADIYGTGPEDLYDLLHDECGLKISMLDGWLAGRRALKREDFRDQFDNARNYYFIAHP